MPGPTGNLSMPGDVPPLPLIPQSMNMMRMRGPSAQRPQLANHMLGPNPHNNSQHLTNNMPRPKSSATIDSQYMQQQSQIFVFTTRLANLAAENVDSRAFPSILEYHCSHPETKRLLERYPLKPQMNRMNCSEALNENLTPQQKQHREKQLAILRKMQQQLCPEMMDSSPMGPMVRMSGPTQSLNAHDFMNQNNMCPNNVCSIPESDHLGGSDPNLNNCMTPSAMMSTQSHSSVPPTAGTDCPKGNFVDERRRKSQNCGPECHNSMCNSNSVPISHPSPLSQTSSALNSPNPCISQSPGRIPPPPYNQGIRPHSSPHPSSPATGSLPLPSPRMQSPVDSSRQQFTPGGQTRLPLTSPRPATPSADSNSSIPGTEVHSPKSLPVSSSLTPIPSATSSTGVQNKNSLTPNPTNTRATTPSTTAPLSSSPSDVKKLPNIMTPKGMKQECPSDLLMSHSSNSESDHKPHSNDMSILGPGLPNNCSSLPNSCSSLPNSCSSVPNSCSSPYNCKEPALMPVPSPQQIQYAMNAYEGQELTIQKQPNTSLRDTDLISATTDMDLGFNPEFGTNCQPFGSNERIPNFPMDMNPRFLSNPQNANMSGHQFDPNPRFMTSDSNNQRFVGPVFDGPNPRIPNHENQFRAQNMLCMPYGQMENNMMRFNTPCDNQMGPRIRHNHPNDMVPRFASHPNDSIQHNVQHSHQFNSSAMSPMSNERMNSMPFSLNPGTGCMSNVNNFNQQMESGVSSTHLQNLQKMTPPFDIGPPNKVDQLMMSNGPHPHNHNLNNQMLPGPGGSMTPQTQRNNFDPISSMAAMSDQNLNSQNMMSGPSMNMTSMHVTGNGPPPGAPNMVNFHTSMSSMQGMHPNMTPDGNGMPNAYGMSPQINPQMSGGPQTVNNTYVNATMSIQQLNIQNGPSPNYNHNLDQNMNIGPQSMPGPGMSPPSGAMQMMQSNSSAKMGPNFGHRMTAPNPNPNFGGQQMNNSRGMNPMNFSPNPHMMQRCSVYNSANVQIKAEAPNTIQYLPPRQQNQNMSSRAPSLDFLNRCEPPLTNLGNKLPTHNLQYFPSNNTNINSSQTMPLGTRMMNQNMPMSARPERPMNPSMVRGSNPNAGLSGPQSMMATREMFGRSPGPNSMNGPPNAMFSNMKQSNGGPMSPSGLPPDSAQPLPPSLSHSYNYKQSPFNGVPVPSDPNYAIQFQHFQQQLYATNTNRNSNSSTNPNNGNNPRMPANDFYNSSK